MTKRYPDVSQLLEEKEARRRELAKLPIEKKLKIVERLRQAANSARGPVQKTDRAAQPAHREKSSS